MSKTVTLDVKTLIIILLLIIIAIIGVWSYTAHNSLKEKISKPNVVDEVEQDKPHEEIYTKSVVVENRDNRENKFQIIFEDKNLNVDTLPSNIRSVIYDNYINVCEPSTRLDDTYDEPKITFEKGFLSNIDFNGDGLGDFVIEAEHARCGEMASFFTGNSLGDAIVFLNQGDGSYKEILNFWRGRGLELQKFGKGYRYFDPWDNSYVEWDDSLQKVVYSHKQGEKLQEAIGSDESIYIRVDDSTH